MDLGVREPQVQTLSLTSCVTLGKSLNLSELQCLLLQHGVVKVLVAQLCPTLCEPMDCSPPGSLCPWDSLGKNDGVGWHALL